MARFGDSTKLKDCHTAGYTKGSFETLACQPSRCGPHTEESAGDCLLARNHIGHYEYSIKLQPVCGKITKQWEGDYED